jgi:signal transduction histidine kinase
MDHYRPGIFLPCRKYFFCLVQVPSCLPGNCFWNEALSFDPPANEYIHVCLFYPGYLSMQKEKLDLIISVVAASLFILLLVISVFFLFRIYLKRKNKLLLEKERMNIEFEQTLLKSQLEIQEHTFNEISREIHDNIGQVLSLVRINLNTLKAPEDGEKLELMDDLVGKAISDLRSLSHSLDADHIRNNGWTPAVKKLLNDLQKSGKYKVTLAIEEELPAIGSDKPIILFRMIQEVVNNIIRHAEADTIWLDVKKETDKLEIAIKDNGKGFDTGKNSTGVGLQNLKNRSKMINAGLLITSDPGYGTTVTISINTENYE